MKLPQKIMLLGAGELGKEFVIAAQRLGLYVVAVDRYPNAPAMQVALAQGGSIEEARSKATTAASLVSIN